MIPKEEVYIINEAGEIFIYNAPIVLFGDGCWHIENREEMERLMACDLVTFIGVI